MSQQDPTPHILANGGQLTLHLRHVLSLARSGDKRPWAHFQKALRYDKSWVFRLFLDHTSASQSELETLWNTTPQEVA